MTYDGPEKRDYEKNGLGRRPYDKQPCPFYDPGGHKCQEVDGVRRTLKWGVGIIITVFIAAFGFFAHNQEKVHTLMLEQTRSVTDLKALIKYQVLPRIKDERGEANERESSVGGLRDNGYRPTATRNSATGGNSGDKR
jgi:hypothetical protein